MTVRDKLRVKAARWRQVAGIKLRSRLYSRRGANIYLSHDEAMAICRDEGVSDPTQLDPPMEMVWVIRLSDEPDA